MAFSSFLPALAQETSDAVVVTGDASIGADVSNSANTNMVSGSGENSTDASAVMTPTDSSSSTKSPESGEALTPEANGTPTAGGGDIIIQGNGYDGSPIQTSNEGLNAESPNQNGSLLNLEVNNENDAVILNGVNVGADSGANSASNNSGNASVRTGSAGAAANIVNIANTNIIDASGFFLLFNNFGALLSGFDFRNLNLSTGGGCDSCAFLGDGSKTSVLNNNSAEVSNDVVVRSSTGYNSLSENSGSATLDTGNAGAAANVFNFVNSNIIGSNYLVFAFNNFGDWSGDLVFPSKYFFQDFLTKGSCCAENLSVENQSQASVINNVETVADSGSNDADGNEGGSAVNTGDVQSGANVSNTVNTNLVGDSTFFLVIRVAGSWAGDVFGVPDEISWRETPAGIELFDNDSAESSSDSGGDSEGARSLDVENNNQATITNNIKVFALTGENKLTGNGGTAGINTGSASAGANVVNVANTNIIGKNWIVALVNIFGDWSGNIAFGRPDLWVGERILVPGDAAGTEIVPGARLTYTITVTNKGDADATSVVLRDRFASGFLEIFSNENGDYPGGNNISWSLGTIKPGEIKEVSYQASIKPQLPFPATELANTATVRSHESDEDLSDNTETTVIRLKRRDTSSLNSIVGSLIPLDPLLNISKTVESADAVRAGGKVHYKITLHNNGYGSAYDVVVKDDLYRSGSREKFLETNSWDLGEVYPGEEVTIEYDLAIVEDAPPGVYKNLASASGRSYNGSLFYSETVSGAVTITEAPMRYIFQDDSGETDLPEEVIETTDAPEEIINYPYMPPFPEVKPKRRIIKPVGDMPARTLSLSKVLGGKEILKQASSAKRYLSIGNLFESYNTRATTSQLESIIFAFSFFSPRL